MAGVIAVVVALPTDEEKRESARAEGKVAECGDGSFSAETNFSQTCADQDGVEIWLASYGRCVDGQDIKLSATASCERHEGFDELLPVDYRPSPRTGDIASCKSGVYTAETVLTDTCRDLGGLDEWLAAYGTCGDGTIIKMSADASCEGHDGFDALLPAGYTPEAQDGDIAQCEDGTFTSNRDLTNTCKTRGGLRRWLAEYGACVDGTVIKMSATAACADHDGFDSLLAPDYVPEAARGDIAECRDGTFTSNSDFKSTCKNRAGLRRWLAEYGECIDGFPIKMATDASCRGHRGFKGLLPNDFEPGPHEGDVARCANNRYSGNTEFAATCASHGGVAEWLARYGQCEDGTIFEMSTSASCASHRGFKALMPADYTPPTTTTTTTAPPSTAPPATAPPVIQSPSPGGGCHPSYTPCVPFASDVDCASGSGNGPEYTGRVTVIGPDVYGLDDDGDGIGCENG